MTNPNNLGNILDQVTKPGRYTGGEWNSVVKDWDNTPIRIVLAYPDLYELGMSNMALPILYELLNNQPDVLAERVFAPWADMAAMMKAGGLPLFSLESRHPLKDFDIIGFSLGYELTYTNVLNMLHLAQIPLLPLLCLLPSLAHCLLSALCFLLRHLYLNRSPVKSYFL